MRRVWLLKEDFGLFHQDITPQEYEFFRTHVGAFKRMWHEQVRAWKCEYREVADCSRHVNYPVSPCLNLTWSFLSFPSLSYSFTHCLLPPTLPHSLFLPPARDCRSPLSIQSRRFWSLFVNAFEHFIWNYGIMKDFPMKVENSHQRLT